MAREPNLPGFVGKTAAVTFGARCCQSSLSVYRTFGWPAFANAGHWLHHDLPELVNRHLLDSISVEAAMQQRAAE